MTKGRIFAVATLLTAVVVVLAGWFTGVRDVMHTVLLTFAVIALLPVILVGAAMAFVIAIGVMGALHGEPIALRVPGKRALAERYYRFFARREHPVFWALPAGAVLGALVLGLVIGVTIVPGEGKTVERMAAAQAAIESHYRAHAAFPVPTPDGTLAIDGQVLGDGFGRPFRYRVRGAWKAASWSLQSTGYDGARDADDLCLSGQTKLMKLADTLALGAAAFTELRRGGASTGTKLAGIQALRCPKTFR